MTNELKLIYSNLKEITETELRLMNREYNPKAWDETVSRFAKHKDIKFYLVPVQGGFSYERYLAVYTIPEGITLVNEVSYSSCLSNSGFCRVHFIGDKMYSQLLKDLQGNYGHCTNDKENRRIMAGNSSKHGVIYSNNY